MKKLLFLLLLPFSLLAGDPVSCGPEVKTYKSLFATVSSVRDGDWHTGSTWSTGKVPNVLDDIILQHNVTTTKNVQVGSVGANGGILNSSRGKLTFLGINEKNFVGSGMSVLASDIGLWVVGSGQLNLTGDAKTSWTNTIGTVLRGATTIVVNSATGWNLGDEIMIATTDKPTNQIDWNDATNSPIDPMIDKFERRIISSINGNQISFATPLKYDHLQVTSTVAKKTWTPEVENLTRSIVIEGTKTGRSHIFIMSNRPQTVKYVEGRWLGPRTPGYRSGNLVNGRYGLHFHHCQEGSTGSIVEGNALHDIGNRSYVPHESDGITFKDNVAHDGMEQMQWWDFQTQSHSITFDHNIQSLRRYNGINSGSVTGNELNQGDDNVMKNNVAIYIHHGDPHQQAAYSWNTNTVGVWLFINNLSHSNITGLFVWQNDNANHTIDGYVSYNDELATHHGAYINEYNYINCIAVNSIVSFEATQGNTNPMFTNYIIDGQGKLPYLVRVLSSPVAAGQSNIWVNPTFSGYTQAAVLINTELFQGEQGRKVVDLVNPNAPNDNLFAFGAKSIYNSMGRVQRGNTAYQVTQSGRTTISPFAPNVYGKGTGLSATYFNGANFNTRAFSRIDPMIKFQQWSIDEGASPNGVHHSVIPGGPFSAVWEGYYEPQSTGLTTFGFESYGGVRLWVDGRQLLNRWSENDDRIKFDASSIVLETGKRYKIRVEHFNTGGNRGIQWYTKVNNFYYNVPISQLYPDTSTVPPVQPNRAPMVSAGSDVVTKDTLLKIEGSAMDPDNNLKSVVWSGSGVTLTQDLSDAAHVRVKGKPGVYTLTIKATDQAGLTASDNMSLTILPTFKPPVDTVITQPVKLFADAGADVLARGTTVELDGSRSIGARLVNWYHDSGPAGWNIVSQNTLKTIANRLQPGLHVFRLKITGVDGKISTDYVTVTIGSAVFTNAAKTDSVTCINGSVITASVPAGKYTSTTQPLADALALQDLNAQLAKCPLPWFTAPYNGKTLYIFGTETNPIIVIK